ncbi:urea ABC transporter ATP-binding protein UrtD [Paenibacillus sp. FSL H8-0457]|uniref:urea ABC transporter ATP-binding protein UrtD n=1 Tax=Paenibacillus TaxID=44249 RepID=UPI0003E2963A|nr:MULTISPECIES: urea ABC transporter ATP-binding protein UrtD [Paenibacillus]ETT56863.1 urea ABC transporter ATP-binding protein UrtD [Paenibacillus sp. FSL H8-457]MCM3256244.1 urea ABC transporter ATP-binding protein UrtD [Paenibacillus lautus]
MQPYAKRADVSLAAHGEVRGIGMSPTVLSAENITVAFGGFVAVNGMNLALRQHELHFLIGPNGAGKTTMLDVICGKTKPGAGRVLLGDGLEITRKRDYEIAGLGVGRKFQAPSIFPNLSVKENLELTVDSDRSVLRALKVRRNRCTTFEMKKVLELIGLPDRLHVRAGSLSHGEKQWLEIGMLLLQKPRLLLLDEPVAGMTDEETMKTGELLQSIAKECSVVVVEHDMEFVRSFAAKVTVMHEGKLLKEGSMQEIQRDPVVAEVYLGKRREANAQAAGH